MNTSLSLPRILIYQDNDYSIMADYLQFYGFDVTTSTEGDILQKIRQRNFDLCILGHYKTTLPGDLRLLKELRKVDRKMPVIFVSDKHHYEYVIEAFDEGADDYIIRPYNLEELIRRIKAVLNRCGIKTKEIEPTYEIGKFIFDTENNTLLIDDTEIKLANKESQILSLLCAYKNELLPKKILMQQVWSEDNYFNKRSLDVHMHTLRNYFKADNTISIETKRGLGYSLIIKQ